MEGGGVGSEDTRLVTFIVHVHGMICLVPEFAHWVDCECELLRGILMGHAPVPFSLLQPVPQPAEACHSVHK